MRGWLLDTKVVSELRKPKPDSKVVNFIAAQPDEMLFVTDVTLAEITYGIEQMGDAARRSWGAGIRSLDECHLRWR